MTGGIGWESIKTDVWGPWLLRKAMDHDYKPPKHLWWTIDGPKGETLVIPKRLSEVQVRMILKAFNDAEKLSPVD